ncbi:MAG: thiol-disulfide oxidoreductase DCC family protein [Planctomycetota bacterium]
MSEAGDHPPIVLFDGICGLCNGLVDFLLRKDRHGRLRYAALQSDAGAHLLERTGVPPEADTIVVVRGGRALLRSDAVLAIARELGPPWSLAGVLRVIPRPIRDLAYRVIARNRYRVFGTRDTCRRPTEAERSRILETDGEARSMLG